MNHSELQMLLSSYLDGEVDDADTAKVLSHLDICSECRQFIEHIKQMRETIRAMGEVELPNDFAARTARLLEKDDEQIQEWLGVEPLARNTFFAIAFLVLVIFMFTNSYSGSSDFARDQLFSGYSSSSVSTRVLLQQNSLSKDDLLYAVMTK